ncbi:MAG: hypothetical protein WC777_01765 [Candidatus Gracilibacteria bacterium]|jgi:hypothetical protein
MKLREVIAGIFLVSSPGLAACTNSPQIEAAPRVEGLAPDLEALELGQEVKRSLEETAQALSNLHSQCKVSKDDEAVLWLGNTSFTPVKGYQTETEKGDVYVFRYDGLIPDEDKTGRKIPLHEFYIVQPEKGTMLMVTEKDGELSELKALHYTGNMVDAAGKILGPLALSKTTSGISFNVDLSQEVDALTTAFGELRGGCPSRYIVPGNSNQAYQSNIYLMFSENRGWSNPDLRIHQDWIESGIARIGSTCGQAANDTREAYQEVTRDYSFRYYPEDWDIAQDSSGAVDGNIIYVNGGTGVSAVIVHEMTHGLTPIPYGMGLYTLFSEGVADVLTHISGLSLPSYKAYVDESLLSAALGPKLYCAPLNDPTFFYNNTQVSTHNPSLRQLSDDFVEGWGINRADKEKVWAIFNPERGRNRQYQDSITVRIPELKRILERNHIDWDTFLLAVDPTSGRLAAEWREL